MQSSDQAKAAVAEELGIAESEKQTFTQQMNNFRLLSENAIPIGPTVGERFEKFFNSNLEVLKNHHNNWKLAYDEFQKTGVAELDQYNTPKENLVRTTVETLVDLTYMRNPQPSFSGTNEEDKKMAMLLEKSLTNLVNKRTFPGINLRPKVIKQITNGHMTNFGLLKLNYQDEKGSIEEVLKLTEEVRTKIKEETDPEKAEVLYAHLDTLQRELDIRQHTGMSISVVSPFALIVSADAKELDFSDSRIVMERDVMDIDHIKAEYMVFDEEENKFYHRYDPTQEFDFSGDASSDKNVAAIKEAIIDDLMPEVDDAQAKVIVENTMPVVWVYDKTTRLKYLYIQGAWQTPLWVYEDTMQLSRFFPFFALAFSTPIQSIVQNGEVAHYIGFQQEINRINEEASFIRNKAYTTFLYDASGVDKKEVEKVFNEMVRGKGTKPRAIGIKLKDTDKRLNDLLEPLRIASAQFKEVFDKTDLRQSLDRATRISDAMKGAQFRTNTTNDAVQTYNEFANNRTESLTDKIEAVVEEIFWSMAELMISKFSKGDLSTLLSPEEVAMFRNMSVTEFNNRFNLQVAAGSSEKPTSRNKKEEAVKIIQMLGQFGTAAPRTVLSIVTKLLRNTFSRSMVSDEDVETLKKEGEAFMQKGISTQQNPQQQNPKGS